jgi:hypothetical protein
MGSAGRANGECREGKWGVSREGKWGVKEGKFINCTDIHRSIDNVETRGGMAFSIYSIGGYILYRALNSASNSDYAPVKK